MSNSNWVALFPGQGSQTLGMAKELASEFPVAREVFEEGSDALRLDLKKLCWESDDATLTQTENTQPALLTASTAVFRVLKSELGFAPIGAAGHSLGEYSALVALGAIPYAKAVTWVRERGRAMQEAVPAGMGAMTAVMGLDDSTIETLCARASDEARKQTGQSSEIVTAANFNAPSQTVISGTVAAVTVAETLLKSGDIPGGKAIRLPVSAPFHSPLMKNASERMKSLFEKEAFTPAPLSAWIVPNRTARAHRESGVILKLLIDQIEGSVMWRQSLEAMSGAGHTQFVEVGPGKVVQGLIKRTLKDATSIGVSDVSSLKAFGEKLK